MNTLNRIKLATVAGVTALTMLACQATTPRISFAPNYQGMAPLSSEKTAESTTTTPTATAYTPQATSGCLPSLAMPSYRFDGTRGDDLRSLYNALYEQIGPASNDKILNANDKIVRVVLNDELDQLEVILNNPANDPKRADISDAQMKDDISMTSGYRNEIQWYTSPCLTNTLETQGKNIEGLAGLIAGSYSARAGSYSQSDISKYISAADIISIDPNPWSDADTDPAVITMVPREASMDPISIPLTMQVGGKTVPDYALLETIQDYLGLPK